MYIIFLVGAWDHTSLSEDAIPIGRYTDRFAWREHNAWEAGQKQTKANHNGTGREVGKRTEGRQIRRVLGTDAGLLRNSKSRYLRESDILFMYFRKG